MMTAIKKYLENLSKSLDFTLNILYDIGMRLNETYAGWLELYSPYSSDKTKLKVGHPGDTVEIISKWVDKGDTWVLIEIYNEFRGWLLQGELSE